MINLISLQWKSFFRSPSFSRDLTSKILLFISFFFIAIYLILIGISIYFILNEIDLEPLEFVNKHIIYLLFLDLIKRYFIQKMPTIDIKPILYLPISKNKIITYSLIKTLFSFSSLYPLFLFIPMSVTFISQGYNDFGIIFWFLSILTLMYCNNFICILINSNMKYLFTLILILSVIVASQYFKLFDITLYTKYIFSSIYDKLWTIVFPFILIIIIYLITHNYLKKNIYLDKISDKKSNIKIQKFSYLDIFKNTGTILKNDIKLLIRNKAGRKIILTPFLFLFYGLLLTNKIYSTSLITIIGFSSSSMFLLTYGQLIPSLDSSYYQLLMTQNISYKDYIKSKWIISVVFTIIFTILSSFYIYFNLSYYKGVLVGMFYNIGVGSYLILISGLYTKIYIDLNSSQRIFTKKTGFNIVSILVFLGILIPPFLSFKLFEFLYNENIGYLSVIILGLLGLSLRNIIFKEIELLYKERKHILIEAFNKKN